MIKSVDYYLEEDADNTKHEIHFTSGLNVISGNTWETTIFNAIKEELTESKEVLKSEDNIESIRDYKTITFINEDNNIQFRPNEIISGLRIRKCDYPKVSELFSKYFNSIMEVKTKYIGADINGDCDIHNCIVISAEWYRINHRITGEDITFSYIAGDEQLALGFALILALRDHLNCKTPLVVDRCLLKLDESIIQGVWSELTKRSEQVIVLDIPRIWEQLKVKPTHVLAD